MQLYLLGHPVSHSKSPAMHNALYKALGLNWQYCLKDCADFPETEEFLQNGEFLGLNITTPYKSLAFQHANESDTSAYLAQGANVFVHADNKSKAYNFDGYGCIRYLQMCGLDFTQQRVVICGTGPTSLAIMHAALAMGAKRVCLLGRNLKRADARLSEWTCRAQEVGLDYDGRLTVSSYEESHEEISRATLVINATPLGMKPDDPAPFDTSSLQTQTTVFDVVYGHGDTSLARSAYERHCQFYNGEGMLVAQAVLGAEQFLLTAKAISQGELDFNWAYKIMCEAAGFSLS